MSVLKNFQNSYSSSDIDQEDESPYSPRKGALKKIGIRETCLTRSPLKVRWKDMIEISNVIEDGYDDDDYDDESEEGDEANMVEKQSERPILEYNHKLEAKRLDDDFDAEDNDENDMHFDEEDDEDEDEIDNDDDDDYEYDEEDEDVNIGLEVVKKKLDKKSDYEVCFDSDLKMSQLIEPLTNDLVQASRTISNNNEGKSGKKPSITNDIIITSEKKNYTRKYEGKSEQFNLKPLHSTGEKLDLKCFQDKTIQNRH